jgi:UDP-N-acetylmuramoylalanine--D-glutamate ligase
LPHRMEWLAHDHGVEWYNDSKGTNVGATLAAIRGLKGKVVLIAGGISKDADFSPLRSALAEKGRAVVLIGRDAAVIENALSGVVPTMHAASMREAVEMARQAAQPTDNVLFSPACASFDMFRNYAHRGEVFAAAVQELLT